MRHPALLAATLVAALPAGSALAANNAAPVVGVVVGSQHGTLLVAGPSGVVRATAGSARIGERISLAGTRVHVLGRVHRAVVRGVVVRHRGNLTFLSAARHVLVVRTARNVASVRDAAPAPGTVVQETVGIGSTGELDEQNEQQIGTSSDVNVQAVITAVGTGTVTISVNGQALTIPLPAGLTLPASLVGTQVSFNLSFAHGQASAMPQQGDDEGDDDSSSSTGTIGPGGAGSLSITGSSSSLARHHGGDDGGNDD